MATIIKRGLLPEELVYQLSCDYCHSIIEFEYKEGSPNYDQKNGQPFLLFKCPVCSKTITSTIKGT
jgi:hypothetical protein